MRFEAKENLKGKLWIYEFRGSSVLGSPFKVTILKGTQVQSSQFSLGRGVRLSLACNFFMVRSGLEAVESIRIE